MTRSRRKKQFAKERENCNPKNICLKCLKPLKGASHHFFHADCYVPGLMYSEEIRNNWSKVYGW